MALQYKDGTFGETIPLNDALVKFEEALQSDTIKAFHVGTPQEIEKVKEDYDLKKRFDELENKLSDMNAEKSKIIAIPSNNDIELYT